MPPTTAPDRPITYSNPQGTALTQIRDNVWWGERSFYPRIPGLTGFDVACKMTVLKMNNGDLWVCAPVTLDRATKAAVDALGPVVRPVRARRAFPREQPVSENSP